MKKNISLLILLISFSSYSQCDSAAIFLEESFNAVCIEVVENVRYVYSNNYPDHDPGTTNAAFALTAQDDTWTMCAYPVLGTTALPLYGDESGLGCTETYVFGVGLNGVKYDPSSAEFFEDTATGDENYDWHVDAYNNFVILQNNDYGAHLNPFGEYHYHGTPDTYYIDDLSIDGTSHSPIVGYAADGYPMYYKYTYANVDGTGGINSFDSGWSLKIGNRSDDGGVTDNDGVSSPSGTPDGIYVEDYEFISSSTELDECNGRYGITPDFPSGTYFYVITDSWPFIPRCFGGTVLDNSFRVGPGASCPVSTASTDCATNPVLSIENIDLSKVVTIYPNPTSDYLNIEIPTSLNSNKISLTLLNSLGEQVLQFENNSKRVDITAIQVGTYYLSVKHSTDEFIQKIIKN